ncbi:MAG: NUDIX hydrolase [Elusimicrobia bacterium]|nr:NUDIX hydrolase [Elusimicrobiota bacterium]
MADFTEKCVRRREIYRGSVNFRVDRVRLPNGRTAIREFTDHPGAVAVVPLLPGGRVVLVRQFRYPVGVVTYEIPAGKLHRGEDRLLCVRRELKEETGFTARSVKPLLQFWPTPAFANELIHIYLARGLKPGAMNPDEDEFVAPAVLPLARALGWVYSGRIRDSKTVIALLTCKARGIK